MSSQESESEQQSSPQEEQEGDQEEEEPRVSEPEEQHEGKETVDDNGGGMYCSIRPCRVTRCANILGAKSDGEPTPGPLCTACDDPL